MCGCVIATIVAIYWHPFAGNFRIPSLLVISRVHVSKEVPTRANVAVHGVSFSFSWTTTFRAARINPFFNSSKNWSLFHHIERQWEQLVIHHGTIGMFFGITEQTGQIRIKTQGKMAILFLQELVQWFQRTRGSDGGYTRAAIELKQKLRQSWTVIHPHFVFDRLILILYCLSIHP